VIDQVDRLGGDADRVAVFGHCLGAGLAYELTRRLAGRGIEVSRLYVSGAAGPRNRSVERISELDDEAFLDGVRRIAGYTHPAMNHPEMREVLMPLLRADSAMHENYRSSYAERVDVPITALRGRRDELVSAEEADEWAAETSAGFRALEVDGGHMYLTDHAESLLRTIADDLEGAHPDYRPTWRTS
jgi:surfactin synthase thioesterase subunit